MANKTFDMSSVPGDPGGQPHLDSPNKLLLGIFAWNMRGGIAPTKAVQSDPERRQEYWKWPAASRLVQEADRIGCDFEVPFGRWLGMHGATRYNEDALDFLGVSAGLADSTQRILLPSTAHAGFGFHPVQFARWGAAMDQMSKGRWALNVVAGWVRDEAEMLGGTFHDHDRRYDICDEFVTLMKLAWSEEDPFDFQGEFFTAKDVKVWPKPYRKPRPILVNAGSSPTGTDFAARQCDWLFLANPSQQLQALADGSARGKAVAELHGRQIKVVTFAYCVWAETDDEAQAEYAVHKELLDEFAVDWHLYRGLDQPGSASGSSFVPNGGEEQHAASLPKKSLREFYGDESYTNYGLGIAGHHIVGGYDTVAEQIRELHDVCGQEGLLFSWIDPLRGLHQLEDEILPRLRLMGLRA